MGNLEEFEDDLAFVAAAETDVFEPIDVEFQGDADLTVDAPFDPERQKLYIEKLSEYYLMVSSKSRGKVTSTTKGIFSHVTSLQPDAIKLGIRQANIRLSGKLPSDIKQTIAIVNKGLLSITSFNGDNRQLEIANSLKFLFRYGQDTSKANWNYNDYIAQLCEIAYISKDRVDRPTVKNATVNPLDADTFETNLIATGFSDKCKEVMQITLDPHTV
jgi:hypothetical protein